jgi:translocation and assembly module TamB
VTLRTAVMTIGGGTVRAEGAVGRRIDLSADITDLPLTLSNAVRPELALSGRLAGRVEATGSIAAPSATFDLSASGLTAAPLQEAGVGPVEASASGGFTRGRIRLDQAAVEGAGLSASASGTVPLSGRGLDLAVSASAPLSLADRFLAERGATLDGEGRADVRVQGSLAAPSVTGTLSAGRIVLRDPLSNLTLRNGTLSARLTGDSVVIDELSAELGGGTVAVSGTVGIRGRFLAELAVTLRQARYTDGRLFAVTLDGDLTVEGPLARSPLVSGEVRIDRAELQVPASLGGSATLIDVRHVQPSYDVLQTLRRARVGPFAESDERRQRAGGLRLDVRVLAPRRVFVRGRGIDAEFGGEVALRGPVSDIRPVGSFELIRGRIRILGQRIVFTEGEVTLLGDLDPQIRMVAETRANQVTVRVIVDGSARDPDVRFESEPELPQDEVLAQLLFKRSLSDLSPFQLARLAAAAAELAGGGGGPGVLQQFRVAAGLDNLELVTTEEGGTAAEAGRYISDNVYLGVRAGAESSGVAVNLDITRGLKVRAEALTDETTLGIYYETEY